MTRVTDDKRKKKRAARGRTGCLTCRERRVKCDEGKPACRRCMTVGRVCKGYEALPLHWKAVEGNASSTTVAPLPVASSRDRQSSWTSVSASSPNSDQDSRPDTQSPISLQGTVSSSESQYTNPLQHFDEDIQIDSNVLHQALMLSPAREASPFEWSIPSSPDIFDGDSLRAIHFYNNKTMPQISSWWSRPLWRLVPQVAYNESSIRHAIIALSSFHEQYTSTSTPPSALRYYMLAIKELRSGTPTTTGILCLMMFFAIELLQRSYSSAIQLLRVARRMIYDMKSDTSELYLTLRNLIRRIDRQVTETVGQIDPQLSYAELWGAEPYLTQHIKVKTEFRSYMDAYEALLNVVQQWLNDPDGDHQSYYDRVQQWRIPFEQYKKRDDLDPLSIQKMPGLEVYWRHYQILMARSRDKPTAQVWWDQHESRLNETIDYLEQDPDMNRGTSFGLEHCLVYELFNISRDCRSPVVRRRILNWMETLNMQEGVLNSELVCKVISKIIQVEEKGQAITCSADIPEEDRIQEVKFDFDQDIKKMKYRINDEWHVSTLKGV